MKLSCYDTVEDVENIQYYKNIKLDLGYPFSKISFNKEEFEECCEVVALKFLSGFNEIDDKEIMLNNNIINNYDLLLWDNNEMLKLFVEKYKKFLLDKNSFTIKLRTKNDYQSILHTVLVPKEWADAPYSEDTVLEGETKKGMFDHIYKK